MHKYCNIVMSHGLIHVATKAQSPAWMSISEFGINPNFLKPFMESPRRRDFIKDHRVPERCIFM